MLSKRSLEGEILLDHGDGPGLSHEHMAMIGLGEYANLQRIVVPCTTCTHCQAQIILNPLRTRDRAYCAGCDHYICDRCKLILVLTGECRPFQKFVDQLQDAAAKGAPIPIFSVSPEPAGFIRTP